MNVIIAGLASVTEFTIPGSRIVWRGIMPDALMERASNIRIQFPIRDALSFQAFA